MANEAPSSLYTYRVIGVLYSVLGLPSLLALVTGNLSRGGNPYFAVSCMGVPLGLLLLAFGLGKLRQNNLSDIAMRVAGAGLINLIFLVGAKMVMDRWHPGFETAYRFFGVLVAFLGTISLVTLLAALGQKRSQA